MNTAGGPIKPDVQNGRNERLTLALVLTDKRAVAHTVRPEASDLESIKVPARDARAPPSPGFHGEMGAENSAEAREICVPMPGRLELTHASCFVASAHQQ